MKKAGYWNHNVAYFGWVKQCVTGCKRILDVGCGDGALIGVLDDGAKQLVGIDCDAYCISKACEEVVSPRVSFLLCDFMDFNTTEPFDAIIFVASIHHMDMVAAIKRAKSMLSPNGKLIIVGIAKPSTVMDYIIEGLRVLPSMIISKCKHMQTTESQNIPVSYTLPTLNEVREIVKSVLPDCSFRQGLFYRYLVEWEKSCE